MLFESRILTDTITRPRSFIGLMALYEDNFVQLQHLIPELERLDGHYQSRVVGDCTLHVEIIQRCRYTITMSLSYFFDEDGRRIADPDMRVRAYLDGQLAEAMSLQGDHRHAELRRLSRRHRRELDIKWRRNIVLNKWLEYLMDRGHLILER